MARLEKYVSWMFLKNRLNALISDPLDAGASEGIRIHVQHGAVSLRDSSPVVALTDAQRGRSEKVKLWRRRVLLKKGARIHIDALRRADDCSMTVLDPSGIVVCWYGRSGDQQRTNAPVLDRHVSQFYLPLDGAQRLAHRHLRAALSDGISSQEGWRLSAAGDVFWGVTNIRVMTHRDGRVQGFVHIIRPSRGPSATAALAARRPAPALGQMLTWRTSQVVPQWAVAA